MCKLTLLRRPRLPNPLEVVDRLVSVPASMLTRCSDELDEVWDPLLDRDDGLDVDAGGRAEHGT